MPSLLPAYMKVVILYERYVRALCVGGGGVSRFGGRFESVSTQESIVRAAPAARLGLFAQE